MADTTTELKTCELCGRLFVRQRYPGQLWDTKLKRFVLVQKVRDCPQCIANPPTEEEQPRYQRSYHVGVKI